MMYISPVLVFVSCVHVGFTEAAPRVSGYDASPISRRAGSASDTWETFHADTPRSSHGSERALARLTALAPSPAAVLANIAAVQSPSTAAPISRLAGARRRSVGAPTSLFAPEETPQTVASQGTANDAGAAVTSVENNQEGLCNCSTGGEGILDPDSCDQVTGQCSCLLGYTGLQCEDCEEGHFTNGTSGCLPCSCDSFGAVDHLCDSSGICVCKMGVYGPKCDECHPGFFYFSSTGCRPCQCYNHTSYCHPQSGVCLNCEGNTQGLNCEDCKPGFYRSPGTGPTETCAPCPCSSSTSTGTCHTGPRGSPVCDRCLPRYSGPQCDECSAGFYKSLGSCVPCDCSGNADPRGPAQLCHPDSGNCLRCMNNTAGPRCQLCAPGFVGDAQMHNCARPTPRLLPTSAPTSSLSMSVAGTTSTLATARGASASTSRSNVSAAPGTTATIQTLLTSLSSPTDNTTAALTDVSWTQFNIIILAVIILVVVLLLGFVGGVYTYREYQNRKLNAPFWTIELKEDNISFSSYHDSIPNADVSGLLEDEANEVAPNGQLALTTQGNCYKA